MVNLRAMDVTPAQAEDVLAAGRGQFGDGGVERLLRELCAGLGARGALVVAPLRAVARPRST